MFCSEGGDCPSGYVCLNSQNCCGVPNCVMTCNSTKTTTTMPTTTESNVCAGIDWSCGDSLTVCGDEGPYNECLCANDVQGNSACVIDESCSTQTQCSQNSNCPSGSICVPGTCCDFSLCLPVCNNASTTNAPTPQPNQAPTTPAPTSTNICSNAEWTCGGSVTICGDQGPLSECFCNEDVNGNHACVIDDYCSDLAPCSQNSGCPSGSVCAPSCCGAGNCFIICTQSKEKEDPLSRLLPITAFSVPSEQEKKCGGEYLECRESCSNNFGRCTAKHGECPQQSVKCLDECKVTREKCLNK